MATKTKKKPVRKATAKTKVPARKKKSAAKSKKSQVKRSKSKPGKKSIALRVQKGKIMSASNDGLSEVQNLDKVKEILFGAEKRDTETRLDQIEKKLRKEVSDMNTQINRRLDSLEAFAKKEFQSVSDQMKAEENDRGAGDDDLSKRLGKLDELSKGGRRELRDEILQQSKTLRAELGDASKDLTKALSANAAELRDDKTSRSDLASLLVDMALRLSKDVELKTRRK